MANLESTNGNGHQSQMKALRKSCRAFYSDPTEVPSLKGYFRSEGLIKCEGNTSCPLSTISEVIASSKEDANRAIRIKFKILLFNCPNAEEDAYRKAISESVIKSTSPKKD